nr:hypothetical protein [Streptomyces sp. TLI_235]
MPAAPDTVLLLAGQQPTVVTATTANLDLVATGRRQTYAGRTSGRSSVTTSAGAEASPGRQPL